MILVGKELTIQTAVFQPVLSVPYLGSITSSPVSNVCKQVRLPAGFLQALEIMDNLENH